MTKHLNAIGLLSAVLGGKVLGLIRAVGGSSNPYGDLRKLRLYYRVPDDYPGKERPWRRVKGLSGKQYRRQEKSLRRRQREAMQ